MEVIEGPALPLRLRAYFDGDRDGEALRGCLEARLRQIGVEPAGFQIRVGREDERDWNREWRQFYRPVWVTDRIVVHPPWLAVATEGEQIAIAIEPAMAFGTGGHESTQLALAALEATGCRGKSCLDVGVGSGVLSVAALRLGAACVTGVDVDLVAVDNARHNLAANLGAQAARARVLLGGVEAVAGERYDVVVANLEGHLLRPLLGPIAAALEPTGTALFSGLLEGELPRLAVWLEEAGLVVDGVWSKGGWSACRAGWRPPAAG